MAKTKTESNKKKKNKRSSSKKLLSGPNVMTMKTKSTSNDSNNPFETIWSRRKFDIIGKKRKGEQQRTGLARSRGIEKRKGTLLKEYEQSGKSSVFVDKRIGEQNESLGEFDKAILRSQRQRQNKKSKYNLSDGEDEYDEIDGVGGGFFERDDYEDDDADADGTEYEQALLKRVNDRNMHDPLETGLGEGRHKSKKEVMEELILKSKYFKAQKSKDKEENEELKEQLDKDFTSLLQSEALLSLTQPSKMNALNALVNKGDLKENLIKKAEMNLPPLNESSKQDKPDSYDKNVKQMSLEKRARPSDRTKTPEEIAQEERERLEQLEEERQKRMHGNDDSSDEDGDPEDVNKVSAKKLRSISGDDLGDSFSFDEKSEIRKGWVDEILQRDADNIDDEEDGSSEDSESDGEASNDEEGLEDNDEPGKTISLKDWEQSDDERLNTDLEDEEEDRGEEEDDDDEDERGIKGKDMQEAKEILSKKFKNRKADPLSAVKPKAIGKEAQGRDDALPFVIEVPNCLSELCSLLEGRSDSEVLEAINRIRVYHAISLAAENRKKMQVFYGVLLQYFAVVANKKPLNFKLLNLLVKPLMEMSMDTPYFAAICARQRIHHTRARFCEDIKNPEKSSWPSMKTLFLLRLWSMIFPCSDFRHVVMTPAVLLMCEYLMRCPITCGRDIAIGSFLCSMVLSVARQSQKFCPEVVIFLRTLLMSTLEAEPRSLQHSQFYYLSELKVLKPWLRLLGHVSDIQSLDFLTVMSMDEDSSFFSSDNFRAGMLMSLIETLRGFVSVYEGYNSFPEIFLPISTLLGEVLRQDNIPGALQDNIRDVSELIEKKAGEHHMLRRPLQMRKQKPVPIKLLNPKFEENFVKGRDYDPDRERSEKKKLQKQINREAKAAARELRKDNQFLFEVKERDRRLIEEERTEKYGKARAFLQEQEHAFKSGQLGKGKKRRR
ncbi:hypothetical protein IFM89_011433 [Coptis chinensis]|uniref:Nucleolar protein 14 n=1 Tax=Coptis chinensis TaxID=261450 RepID=A0A835ISR2_9MAGN|nr:hypothetical protein IFM89_011433 [Coptis chinensis]